ncbi:bifunctional diguanylate cyclase/phosphodiesterase [Aestuariibacter sp. A3R04]|uniref:putative bifunctional diguanylate cyclase/phosphodiesterase n=1 Tax=Aestuariibacter sp. A3R04 TaxID=2841571 RepID=UPI001C09FDA6|nr:GGDEF domain-containing phosphodiesterase [Aestuariibacter sp. A3R04]MBU3021988.1 EAL domain-containing protein [Aestuariibacter sp. A3R04]
MDIFQLNALGITDCALFEFTSGNELRCLTPTVHWLADIIKIKENSLFVDTVESLFLDDFMIDAQTCWESAEKRQVSSGFWTETTSSTQLRLEAIAIQKGPHDRYLAIKNVSKEFEYRQQSLQTARELLLTHHAVISQQDYLNDKLRTVLSEAEDCQLQQNAIKQTIQHLHTGVLITDASKKLFLDNSVARQMLRADDTNSTRQLFQLLQDVHISASFLSTLEARKDSWRGEVYWHNAPGGGRWLQLTIASVFADDTLTHWVFLISDISKLQQSSEQAEPTFGRDSLTQIASRQAFKNEITRWITEKRCFGLFIIDVCEFRRINENLGYRIGDDILKNVAKRLSKHTSKGSFLARISGNEFALLMPLAEENESALLEAARLLKGDFDHAFVSLGNTKTILAVNMGVAQYPKHGDSADTMFHNAGLALQFAKSNGRNQVVIYRDQLKQKQQEVAELESALTIAIADGQLSLHLQPIVELETGNLVKCEALTRWQTKDGQMIPPDTFIPVAENSDLIFSFGDWLLEEVCTIAKQFQEDFPTLRIAINISGRQIADPDFLKIVSAAVKKHGISPSQLSIEITETIFIQDNNTVAVTLTELRAMGVTISIDDFGTGFSSLEYLKRLPIDELKIDRAFVRDLTVNADDKAIIQAILALAANLDLAVVAEGVESDEQQHFLRRENCILGQGYLFDKPMPVDAFITRFK